MGITNRCFSIHSKWSMSNTISMMMMINIVYVVSLQYCSPINGVTNQQYKKKNPEMYTENEKATEQVQHKDSIFTWSPLTLASLVKNERDRQSVKECNEQQQKKEKCRSLFKFILSVLMISIHSKNTFERRIKTVSMIWYKKWCDSGITIYGMAIVFCHRKKIHTSNNYHFVSIRHLAMWAQLTHGALLLFETKKEKKNTRTKNQQRKKHIHNRCRCFRFDMYLISRSNCWWYFIRYASGAYKTIGISIFSIICEMQQSYTSTDRSK